MIQRVLGDVVFSGRETTLCIIDPDPNNKVAIRAYEKAGFRYLKTIEPPEHIEPAYLMTMHREEFEKL